jgi:hypothetical protein
MDEFLLEIFIFGERTDGRASIRRSERGFAWIIREEASNGGFVKRIPMIYERPPYTEQVSLILYYSKNQSSAVCAEEVWNLRGTGTRVKGLMQTRV